MSSTRAYPSRASRPRPMQNGEFSSDRPTGPESTPSDPRNQPPTTEQCGAYSVKRPDPAKREKIKNIAAAETQAYNQYKQDRKQVRYTTTTAAVGASSDYRGGYAPPRAVQPSTSMVTRAAVSGNAGGVGVQSRRAVPGGFTAPRTKPLSLKTQTARMEDPEIAQRKAEQRRKAEALKLKEDGRQRQLNMDRRQKNSQFLDRLSNGYP